MSIDVEGLSDNELEELAASIAKRQEATAIAQTAANDAAEHARAAIEADTPAAATAAATAAADEAAVAVEASIIAGNLDADNAAVAALESAESAVDAAVTPEPTEPVEAVIEDDPMPVEVVEAHADGGEPSPVATVDNPADVIEADTEPAEPVEDDEPPRKSHPYYRKMGSNR